MSKDIQSREMFADNRLVFKQRKGMANQKLMRKKMGQVLEIQRSIQVDVKEKAGMILKANRMNRH